MKTASIHCHATLVAVSRCLLALATVAALAAPSKAAINFYRVEKNIAYVQTSDAQPAAPDHYWGAVDVIFDNPLDLTAGFVTAPSPLSPMVLNGSPGFYIDYTPNFGSQADLDTALPNGAPYQYHVSGGVLGNQSALLVTPGSNLFAAATPAFSGTTYDQLQGTNSTAPQLLTFNGFATTPGATFSAIDLSIFRVSDGQFMYGTSGDNTLTSAVIPANTLAPGTAYTIEMIYDSRVSTPQSGFNGATAEVLYDSRTDLTFTTAPVPEPGSLILFGLGAMSLAATAARRYRRAAKE